MKKFFLISGGIVFLILGVAFALPFIFKDEIKQAINNEIRKRVDADVKFGDYSVTLFRHFPNLTASLQDFSVVNHAPFQGDTLVSVKNFNIVVNIWSVLFGQKYELKKIVMDAPRIHATVTKSGKASWDIMKPEPEVAVSDTSSADSGRTSFNIVLTEYGIYDGYLLYDDRSSGTWLEVAGLNHKGSGNFSSNEFEFYTTTETPSATFRQDGTYYLRKGKLDLEVNVKINQQSGTYTLMKNNFGFNELNLHLDGWLKMPGDDIEMDLKFGTDETSFRSLLSIVPGMYTDKFKDVNTSGEFKLDGFVKGIYNDKKTPGFLVNLELINGFFQYPDLPQSVSNINGKISVDAADGNLDNMKVNVPKLHADFGNNPIDAKLILSGLNSENMNIDADIKAVMNLEELQKMYPMEGQVLKGKFSADVKAAGMYNASRGIFPKVNAQLSLENGYVKSADFPSAIDHLGFSAEMNNPTGVLSQTTLNVPKFHAEIDGDPVDAIFSVKNFDNPEYNASVKGNLDLQKLSKIYPVEGTTMSGKLAVDIKTQGVYSDVQNGNYMNLPTSGTAAFTGVKYKSIDVPQGVEIDIARLGFTPQKINIEQFAGKLGHSAVTFGGYLDNYLAWMMMENQELRGAMNLNSDFFDVNEWMAEEPAGTPAQGAAAVAPQDAEMYAFEVPKGIDFVFTVAVAKVIYDNLTINNLAGRVIIKNQEIRFEGLNFMTLGSRFGLNGTYNTADIRNPVYNMNFSIAGLQVRQAWEKFNTIQALVPAGQFVNGLMNSTFSMSGKLRPDMMPDIPSMTGGGDFQLQNASVTNFPVLKEIADKTKLAIMNQLKIDDQKFEFEFKNGRYIVKPFTLKSGNVTMNAEGSNGLDKSIDYKLNFDIPTGAAGVSATNALSGLTGQKFAATDKVNVDLSLGGTVDKPIIKGAGSSATAALKDQVTDMAQDKIEDLKDQAQEKVEDMKNEAQQKAQEELDKAKKEAERLKNEAEAKAKAELDRQKQEAERRANEEKERLRKEAEAAKKKAEEEAKKKLKGLLK